MCLPDLPPSCLPDLPDMFTGFTSVVFTGFTASICEVLTGFTSVVFTGFTGLPECWPGLPPCGFPDLTNLPDVFTTLGKPNL